MAMLLPASMSKPGHGPNMLPVLRQIRPLLSRLIDMYAELQFVDDVIVKWDAYLKSSLVAVTGDRSQRNTMNYDVNTGYNDADDAPYV